MYRIKTSVPFLIYPIAKKDTLNCSYFKFDPSLFEMMNKDNIAKDAKE